MSEYLEEKKIKELFQELKQEDERLASSFAKDWEAALSRTGGARRRRSVLSLAIASALILIALCGSAIIFFRGIVTHSAPAISSRPITVEPELPSPSASIRHTEKESKNVRLRSVPSGKRLARITRRERVRPRQSAVLITQWHPPTDFLLKYPDQQIFKTVPRLGETLMDIDATLMDRQN